MAFRKNWFPAGDPPSFHASTDQQTVSQSTTSPLRLASRARLHNQYQLSKVFIVEEKYASPAFCQERPSLCRLFFFLSLALLCFVFHPHKTNKQTNSSKTDLTEGSLRAGSKAVRPPTQSLTRPFARICAFVPARHTREKRKRVRERERRPQARVATLERLSHT